MKEETEKGLETDKPITFEDILIIVNKINPMGGFLGFTVTPNYWSILKKSLQNYPGKLISSLDVAETIEVRTQIEPIIRWIDREAMMRHVRFSSEIATIYGVVDNHKSGDKNDTSIPD